MIIHLSFIFESKKDLKKGGNKYFLDKINVEGKHKCFQFNLMTFKILSLVKLVSI